MAFMNEDQPVRPANIVNIVGINQGKRPLTMGEPHAPGLTARRFAALLAEAHLVIDARDAAEFGAGHIPNAYNIQLSSPEFEQRVGWVTPLDVPLLLVLDDDADAARALHNLAFLGLDQRVKGYLAGGMKAWYSAGHMQATLPQISVHQLQAHLQNGIGMRVLDVRETSEWDEGHIEGALYLNYKQLRDRADELGLPLDAHLAVVCASGMRSSTASSLLQMAGFERIYNVTGGMNAWAAARLPMVDPAGRPVRWPHASKPDWFEQ